MNCNEQYCSYWNGKTCLKRYCPFRNETYCKIFECECPMKEPEPKHTLEEYRKKKVVPTRLQYEDYYRNSKEEKEVEE